MLGDLYAERRVAAKREAVVPLSKVFDSAAAAAAGDAAAARGRSAGFTLLEVVIAVVVLGLVVVALSSGLKFALLAVASEERGAARQVDLPVADATLRDLIVHAWPGGATGLRGGMLGTARTLYLRTRMPQGMPRLFGRAGTRDAEISIGVDAERRLTIQWLPYRENWIARPRPEQAVLLPDVERIEFAYWDPGLRPPANGWVREWQGNRLPRLIRMRLVFTASSGLRWPDIIAAPARGADAL